MGKNFITGLDIGTSSIKVAIVEKKGDRLNLKAVFKEPSLGMRKGAICDLTESAQAVGRVLSQVKGISRSALKNIYVNIGTPQVRVQGSKGFIAVSRADSEIYKDDIDRAIRAAQAINIGPNRMVIHTIAREYIIDGVGEILDPLGLNGNRLEVNCLIIDAFSPHVKNLMKVIELVGGEVGGMVFTPLASARSVLSKVQRDLGVALIDIGSGTTGLSVYEEGKLLGVSNFPAGAGNISNDLAIGLKVPVAQAEMVKLNYGHAIAKEVGSRESIELAKFMPETEGNVSRRFVAEIVEARLAEIFEFVNNELKLLGKAGKLAGGAVLVGGGAKLPGLTELCKKELKLFSQIGMTAGDKWMMESGDFSEYVEDPEYVNALGLSLWGADQEDWHPTVSPAGIARKLKRFFSYFSP